ncbi:superoxide dismutase [Novosphingobium sp. TH158]|uniref:superoxide dismutase n=1 Tax=Novosphingobium sp. TH158 TaxID=2067455 RepID=UPI000C79B7BC|nr:superoxide dismutase [Novosphingobium sp. TH158]PLK25954.1 superoxide dismutase [Fe] [Novosphingobium sp. TH158]
MFQLPELEYDEGALEPHISRRTMEFHHGKHHRAYVEGLNAAIAGTRFETMSLEAIIIACASSDSPEERKIFNNAGQHWNHSFFWKCMRPGAGGQPVGPVATLLGDAFGGLPEFREQFIQHGKAHFGSGWLWLVMADDGLEICTTHDADTPFVEGKLPLLVCDLWEHAYYLDYQNQRAEFLARFIDQLADWRFVADALERAGLLVPDEAEAVVMPADATGNN